MGTGTAKIKLLKQILLTTPPWGLPAGRLLAPGSEHTVGEDTANTMVAAGEAEIVGPGEPTVGADEEHEEVIEEKTGVTRLQPKKKK